MTMERNGMFYKNLKIIGLLVTLIITTSSITTNFVLANKYSDKCLVLEERMKQGELVDADLRMCVNAMKEQLNEVKIQLEGIRVQMEMSVRELEKLNAKFDRR